MSANQATEQATAKRILEAFEANVRFTISYAELFETDRLLTIATTHGIGCNFVNPSNGKSSAQKILDEMTNK